MAYIYLHRRNDTGEVFYVGKGTGGRATDGRSRNPHWQNVVNKAGYTVEIIAKGLTDDEAYWAEPLLIEAHGGVENLTNMSDGGEGFSSEESKALWQDPEYREKISKAMKEQWQDPAFREKISKFQKERKIEQWKDPEYRDKHSKAVKELWQDPDHREKVSKKISKTSKELWQDPAHREKVTRKVECDKCGRMIGVTNLPQHQRGPRCA